MKQPNISQELLSKLGELLMNNPFAKSLDPNPNNYPEIIYKYRNWNEPYHKRLLIDNELYMSPPSLFNDPFDFRIYKNHSLLNTPEKIENFINQSIENAAEWIKDNDKNVIEQKKILEERLSDLTMYQVRSDYHDNEMYNNFFGVACFSKKWNSTLMWSHYANNHNGFCLGFDEKRIRYSMLFGMCDYVKYSEDYPIIHPNDNNVIRRQLQIFTKSIEWEYEQEYRVVKLYYNDGIAEPDSPKRIVKLDNTFITEVILGLAMSKKDKIEITQIAKDRNIDVYEIFKVPNKFELEKFKID